MRIYVTFCSEKKFDVKREIPKYLYDSKRIQAFIKRCEYAGARYALLSGKYGVVFEDEKIKTYNQYIGDVPQQEYEKIVEKVRERLKGFKVYFYEPNPRRAKKYNQLLKDAGIKFTPFRKVSFILDNEKC